MITQLPILDTFYKILNVTELTDIISGGIYKIEKPQNSELQDIVINSLPLKSGYLQEIQNGVININCYSKNLNGQPDTLKLDEIAIKVILLLERYSQGTTYLNYEIESTTILKELQQNSLSFLNLKINIHSLK